MLTKVKMKLNNGYVNVILNDMKTKQELMAYKSDIVSDFGSCTVLNVTKDNLMTNCNNTADRKAAKGWSWIEYWRAMTGKTDTQLSCASCGKLIYVGSIPKMMERMYALTGDEPEKHIAHGGHVWVNAPKDAKYSGGRYIVPLCPYCNGQHGQKILIKEGSVLCKELGSE